MYKIVEEALAEAGLRDCCTMDDRGDGMLLVFDPVVSKVDITEAFAVRFQDKLRDHARLHSDEAQMRMRVALHAGDVTRTDRSWSGRAVNTTFRLVDAAVTRDRLTAAPDSLLVMIVSDHWHQATVRDEHGQSEAGGYEQVHVSNKEVEETAWLRLLGAVSLPHHTDRPRTTERPRGTEPQRTASGGINFYGTVTVHGDVIGNSKTVHGREPR